MRLLSASIRCQQGNLRAAGSNPAGDSFRNTHSNLHFTFMIMKTKCVSTTNKGAMAEWSNATDLSSVSFGSAGSNPAGTILGYHTATTMNFELSSTAVLLRGFESRHTYQVVCIQVVKGGFSRQWYPTTNNDSPLSSVGLEHQTFNLRVAGSSPAGDFVR